MKKEEVAEPSGTRTSNGPLQRRPVRLVVGRPRQGRTVQPGDISSDRASTLEPNRF